MSSVWDDPEPDEIDHEDLTPLPETQGTQAAPLLPPEKLEDITTQVVEKVVREVVPEIAERLIQQKIDELLSEDQE